MIADDDVAHLVPGPRGHGVVEHARGLARACGRQARWPEGALAEQVAHLSFTDALYGRGVEEAVAAVLAVGDRVHRCGRRWSVTLHDLPQADDDHAGDRRRRAYATLAAAADGVVVSSRHEQALLSDTGGPGPRALAVIPLPMTLPVPDPGRGAGPELEPGLAGAAVVFGFLYPGKGHAEAIEALAAAPPDVPRRLVALGAPSAGHETLAADLAAAAAAREVAFTVTGPVPDLAVGPGLRAAGIPLAPHRHVSASGSVATWIAAGRRPLVSESRYTRELLERWPGCVHPVAEGDWPAAISRARTDPAWTRSEGPPPWGWAEVADAYRRFWTQVRDRG